MSERRFCCPDCRDLEYTPRQVLLAGGCCLDCGAPLESLASSSPINAHRLIFGFQMDGEGPLGQPQESHRWVALQVVPVKGDVREVEAITQLLNSLGRVGAPISFEIAGTDRRRFLLVRCRNEHAEMVKARLTVIYGNPEVIELSPQEDPLSRFSRADHVGTTQMRLRKPAGLPLRTYHELGTNDTIMPLLSALYDLGEGEAACIQVVIHGEAPEDWAAPYKQELLAIKRRQQGLLSSTQLGKLFALLLGFGCLALAIAFGLLGSRLIGGILFAAGTGLAAVGLRFFRGSDLAWSEAQEEMVSRKIQMPAYRVEIRLNAGSTDRTRTRRRLESLIGAFKVFGLESGNFLEAGPIRYAQRCGLASIENQDPDTICLLGDAEIATLWHLPVEDLPDMLESRRVRHVLPDIQSVSEMENGWYVGQSRKSAGVPVEIWLPCDTITRTHALLIGRTRMGKSNTLEHMIREAARDPGRTVVVIDPHDDMVENLLGLIPADRVGDVLYLNFGDEQLRPAFNPLDVTLYSGDPEAAAGAFQEVAHALYKRYWGPRMEVPFHRAVMALTLANSVREPESQFTVLDVLALLQFGAEERAAFLEAVLPDEAILKRTIISYFNYEFGSLQKAFREQVVMPVLSKLRPFESNSYLLSIFGQSRSSFNLIQAVQDGKIILVRTGAARVTKEYSDFLGSLLLNMVRKAVFMQSGLAAEERRPVTIFVDESQSFSGIDYGEALAEIAKFGGNLVISTQGAKTIGRSTSSDQTDDPHAFSKIMDNVDTVFVFRLSGENARALSETEFWRELSPADLINLDKYQAFVRYSKGERVVGPFKVHLSGPLEEDEGVKSMILQQRVRYLRPVGELMASAERSLSRMVRHFHSEKAIEARIHDGGEAVSRFDAAAAAEEMANNIPDLEGVGLDFVLGALGELNVTPPGEEKGSG